jgi:hypothetical protein
MLKPHGTCKLCDSSSFLNYAGLCKRCNRKEASTKITGEAVEKQKKALEAQKEMEKQKPVEPEEEPAPEEKSDETEDEAKEEGTDDKEKEDEKDSK